MQYSRCNIQYATCNVQYALHVVTICIAYCNNMHCILYVYVYGIWHMVYCILHIVYCIWYINYILGGRGKQIDRALIN